MLNLGSKLMQLNSFQKKRRTVKEAVGVFTSPFGVANSIDSLICVRVEIVYTEKRKLFPLL